MHPKQHSKQRQPQRECKYGQHPQHFTGHLHDTTETTVIIRQPEVEIYVSGASRHMSSFRYRFINYRTIPSRSITASNKHISYAIGAGDLQIDVPPQCDDTTLVLLFDIAGVGTVS